MQTKFIITSKLKTKLEFFKKRNIYFRVSVFIKALGTCPCSKIYISLSEIIAFDEVERKPNFVA